ncbi:LysM domain-containing protein [Paramyrothecium foliicola]|nr:LysM domain-containing protein [Paramyrothecium foliicola]
MLPVVFPVAEVAALNSSTDKTCNSLEKGAYACISTRPSGRIPWGSLPGVVDNCDKFYLYSGIETCASIAEMFRINLVEVIKWNGLPATNCDAGLQASYHMCVSIIGHPHI